ncbi:outer membrane beta-barrel protein [Shivajiella indica]|uniref:Outer membrane beta-barrel protein n=1 Tax=Shivajiella indica TaxID=872115 RepID=A0ABW5B736_9BACT
MRKIGLSLLFILSVSLGMAQVNKVHLSGGYTLANIDDSDLSGDGWRINGKYEYQPIGTLISYGLSIGYMSVSTEETNAKYTVNVVPIYFNPRLYFREGKMKPFLQGALGFHMSNQKREGTLGSVKSNDSGVTLGAGAGTIYSLNDQLFLNLEYELLYLANGFYKNNLTNSFNLGIGVKF